MIAPVVHQETLSESVVEVSGILVSAITSWVVSVLVIKRDEKKLSEEMLLRAYPPATLGSSVFLFQQLAVLVHFIRTRRSVRGFFLGIAWTVAAFVPSILIDAIFGLFVD